MLPSQTLRMIARDLRAIHFTPSNADHLLGKYGATIHQKLRPLLEQMLHEGATPRLMGLMLEQLADSQARWEEEYKAWNFIWSGPRPENELNQDTYATVTKLIREARSSLLLSTYNIGASSEIRELIDVITAHLKSGVLKRFDLFFHPVQIKDDLKVSADRERIIRTWFYGKIWDEQVPINAYIDARLLRPGEITTYQHAKAVIVNADTPQGEALVTSANFSGPGQRHNFEAGWLVKSASRARKLQEHFLKMVAEGFYIPITPPQP